MNKFVFFDEWLENVSKILNVKKEALDRLWWIKLYYSAYTEQEAVVEYQLLEEENKE